MTNSPAAAAPVATTRVPAHLVEAGQVFVHRKSGRFYMCYRAQEGTHGPSFNQIRQLPDGRWFDYGPGGVRIDTLTKAFLADFRVQVVGGKCEWVPGSGSVVIRPLA